MYKSSRSKSDYKEGDIVYFARIEDNISPYITLKKCIIKEINPRTNDFKCDAIYDYIEDGNLSYYTDWYVAYDWLARSFDEAIQEIADYKKTDNRRKIKILFNKWGK